jgi:hypothetical protein
MEGVVSATSSLEEPTDHEPTIDQKMTARKAVSQAKNARDKSKAMKAKAKARALERKLAPKPSVQVNQTSDDDNAVQPNVPTASDDQSAQPTFVPDPNGAHRLIPVDAFNAPDDGDFGRKKAVKGEVDLTLLHVLCYDSRTGAKRELHFGKIPTADIDWELSSHITAINGWRTQIWSRAGYKMKNVSLYHQTEDDWLELFVSLSVAQGMKKPVRFASVNYIVGQFNEFFVGKCLKNADGTDTEPRPERSSSSFASKVGRVANTVKKTNIHFEKAFDREAREFKPTITAKMLKAFQDEKVKLGGSRGAYNGKKKVPRIEQTICKSLVDLCATFLDDGKRAKSMGTRKATSASAGSAPTQTKTKLPSVVSSPVATDLSSSDSGEHGDDKNSGDYGSDGHQPVNDAHANTDGPDDHTVEHSVEALGQQLYNAANEIETSDSSDQNVTSDNDESGAAPPHVSKNGVSEQDNTESSSVKDVSGDVATEEVEDASQNGSNDGSFEKDVCKNAVYNDVELPGDHVSDAESSGKVAPEVLTPLPSQNIPLDADKYLSMRTEAEMEVAKALIALSRSCETIHEKL